MEAVTLYSSLSETNSVSLAFLAKFIGFLKHCLQSSSVELPLAPLLTVLSVYNSKPNHNVLEDVMIDLCMKHLVGVRSRVREERLEHQTTR